MKVGSIIALIGGLTLMGIVGYMMFFVTKAPPETREAPKLQADVPPSRPTVMVLVALADLQVGTFVRKENLKWHIWPAESVLPAYVTKEDSLVDANQGDKKLTIKDFTGAVVRLPIAAGQPMTPGLVARAGKRGFMAAVLRPGMRAMSIGVGATSAVAGFILPGDRVDMLWSMNLNGEPAVQTLLTDIRVIAIDQKTQANKATSAGTLTLELTPKQVEGITLARTQGRLEFTLRSIVPDKEKEVGDEFAEQIIAVSDGVDGTPLLGTDLASAGAADVGEGWVFDSYTVTKDLVYGRRTTRPRTTVRTASTGTRTTKAPTTSKTARIRIYRGTKSTVVKVR
jgi:pilus assembly protein CpaB